MSDYSDDSLGEYGQDEFYQFTNEPGSESPGHSPISKGGEVTPRKYLERICLDELDTLERPMYQDNTPYEHVKTGVKTEDPEYYEEHIPEYINADTKQSHDTEYYETKTELYEKEYAKLLAKESKVTYKPPPPHHYQKISKNMKMQTEDLNPPQMPKTSHVKKFNTSKQPRNRSVTKPSSYADMHNSNSPSKHKKAVDPLSIFKPVKGNRSTGRQPIYQTMNTSREELEKNHTQEFQRYEEQFHQPLTKYHRQSISQTSFDESFGSEALAQHLPPDTSLNIVQDPQPGYMPSAYHVKPVRAMRRKTVEEDIYLDYNQKSHQEVSDGIMRRNIVQSVQPDYMHNSYPTEPQEIVSDTMMRSVQRPTMSPAQDPPKSKSLDSYLEIKRAAGEPPKYKKYSMKNYKTIQSAQGLYRTRGLGPERAPTQDSLRYERRKNFAEAVRYMNKGKIRPNQEEKVDIMTLELERKREIRKKQLEYAKSIPTPLRQARNVGHIRSAPPKLGKKPSQAVDTDLDALMSRHRAEQARVTRLRSLVNIN